MIRRSVIALLTLSACAPQAPDHGPTADERPAAPVAFATPVHVAGLGGLAFTTVQTFGGRALVGTDHGLYASSSPDGGLAWFGGSALAGRAILATTTFDGALFVHAKGPDGKHALLRSRDGGASWTDASDGVRFGSSSDPSQFAASATRLVFDTGGEAYDWDAKTGSFRAIESGKTRPDRVAFDGDELVVDGVGHGVFVEESKGTFAEVVSLDNAWGYTAFSFGGDRGVTANLESVFLRDPYGNWSAAYTNPICGFVASSLFSTGGLVLAAGSTNLERSVNGVTWTDVADARTLSSQALAGDASRIWWISDALRSSTDLGASWTKDTSDVAVATEIAVGGGRIYAMNAAEEVVDAADGAFDAPIDSFDFATTDRELWTCSWDGCLHAAHGSDSFEGTVTLPPGFGLHPGGIFTTSSRAFYASFSAGCHERGAVELSRFDERTGAWRSVGAGLPDAEDRACTSPFAGRDVPLRGWSEADGILFADVSGAGTFRSIDDGEHWSEVRGAEVVKVTACAGAILGVTTGGHLVRSDDEGASFSRVAGAPGAAASLANVAGQCLLGVEAYDGSATLFGSSDASTFSPLDFHEPVTALAADATTLAISTTTSGVFRASLVRP